MGKLIVIEGKTDGVGKETQSNKLYKRLKEEGFNVRKITFPNYGTKGCAAVESYLNGDLGDNPSLINPYTVSTFFAIDRFFSFAKDWGDFYKEDGIIISDRYTTSNMIHQASKIKDIGEMESYLNWLYDLEFNKYSLPIPDSVIFLDVPLEYSLELMSNRKNKITNKDEKDIHEKDTLYLKSCADNADYIADKFKWERINCIKGNSLREISDIHEEIYKRVVEKIK